MKLFYIPIVFILACQFADAPPPKSAKKSVRERYYKVRIEHEVTKQTGWEKLETSLMEFLNDTAFSAARKFIFDNSRIARLENRE